MVTLSNISIMATKIVKKKEKHTVNPKDCNKIPKKAKKSSGRDEPIVSKKDAILDDYERSKFKTKRYKKIIKLLENTFGYSQFRPKQYEIINSIIQQKDICAVLPTGYGKSLTFILPALYLEKSAIVISPLISLMNDQRIILDELGITSCCYNSTVPDRDNLQEQILEGCYQIIYITPESAIKILPLFQMLDEMVGISLIAIDEAHCISSYGHDFRKDYREIYIFKELLPNVPILAVTATATVQVGKDICKVLGFTDKNLIKSSFDRPNLYLQVNTKSTDIARDIIPIVEKYCDEPVIIYCLTRKNTEKIAELLISNNIDCGIYHSGLEASIKDQAHRNFLDGTVNVIAATIAFGMGINKSNVRAIIHYGSPRNIEGYYQEIGRAGRDGKPSFCYTFYNDGDFRIQRRFIADMQNIKYRKSQEEMLNKMHDYLRTGLCRRRKLLHYFAENHPGNCGKCDNCNNVARLPSSIKTYKQDVMPYAKLLIELMCSMEQNYGMTMYINILRGSKNKNITKAIAKNKYYDTGKAKSAKWWKEMASNLSETGIIHTVYIAGGIGAQYVEPTIEGLKLVEDNHIEELLGAGKQSLIMDMMVQN
jgi:RecQ family ATP-dependent DNA helicase